MEIITRKDFRRLVEGLLGDYTLYGPVEKEGFPAFARIERFSQLRLSRTPTHLSAKEFLFPPRETLLRFDLKSGDVREVVDAQNQAIIGLHPCDIHAVNLLDRVFSYGTPDRNYLARRKRTVIIGTECTPDEYCFCSSLHTMTVDRGFDLFLHETERGFIVRTGTKRGRRLLERHTSATKAEKADLERLERMVERKEKMFRTRLDAEPSQLPLIYRGADSSPVWDRIGRVCYGCGSCNHVCPTCYCFDVKDDITLDLEDATRYRVWDGCTLEDFAKVAGGHNFRKARSARLRHRFNRKFRYLADRFKGLFCVGCGRCSRTCLVRINISEVTNEIIRETKER